MKPIDILWMIVISSMLFLFFVVVSTTKEHKGDKRLWEAERDSLNTVIHDLDSRLARSVNRLSYWEMYAKSHQYNAKVETCKVLCGKYEVTLIYKGLEP